MWRHVAAWNRSEITIRLRPFTRVRTRAPTSALYIIFSASLRLSLYTQAKTVHHLAQLRSTARRSRPTRSAPSTITARPSKATCAQLLARQTRRSTLATASAASSPRRMPVSALPSKSLSCSLARSQASIKQLAPLFAAVKMKMEPKIPTWMSSHPDYSAICARPANSLGPIARFKGLIPPGWVQVRVVVPRCASSTLARASWSHNPHPLQEKCVGCCVPPAPVPEKEDDSLALIVSVYKCVPRPHMSSPIRYVLDRCSCHLGAPCADILCRSSCD
jgi:hypothetical protein